MTYRERIDLHIFGLSSVCLQTSSTWCKNSVSDRSNALRDGPRIYPGHVISGHMQETSCFTGLCTPTLRPLQLISRHIFSNIEAKANALRSKWMGFPNTLRHRKDFMLSWSIENIQLMVTLLTIKLVGSIPPLLHNVLPILCLLLIDTYELAKSQSFAYWYVFTLLLWVSSLERSLLWASRSMTEMY